MTAAPLKEEKKSVIGQETAKPILFVCTGNTCRSPMAEAMYEALSGQKDSALSAGIFPAVGEPVSENAIAALEKRGIDCQKAKSRGAVRADAFLLERCERAVAMTASHAMMLMSEYPQYASKIFSMPTDIPDPFGGDEAAYEACLSKIEEGLRALFPLS
ncbi:MAG: low molecular weight protein arginine phosphatase [Ruminococcaceae bacterium]|nr:low molecular weight protein arginine phosphatase [Oscillospiraceae bacterium]